MPETVAPVDDKAAEAILKDIGRETALDMLKSMTTIRAFEEKAEWLYSMGKLHGTMHLSIGQEATAVGSSYATRRGEDYLLNHHRGHGHCLAWGSEASKMMAEFRGKETGYCRGRGGSMHIADVDRNNLGANGIVAGGLPISVGVGLSIQLRKTDQICLIIFGDGANNEGAFHEAMNMASVWKLPVVFLCENNQYAMSMDIDKAMNIDYVSIRAAGYGVPGVTVDGNDVPSVYQAISEAVARARRGEGPTLVEAMTYRWKGHSKSDRQAYRTRDEVKEWMQRDPIPRFVARLKALGWITDEEAEAIRTEALDSIEKAVEFADNSPDPDLSTLLEGVYA